MCVIKHNYLHYNLASQPDINRQPLENNFNYDGAGMKSPWWPLSHVKKK